MSPPAAGDATAPHRRVLAIVIALILYGSLYPWQFHVRHYFPGPLWILLHSWPRTLDRYVVWDVAVNTALYAPLGIFAYLAVTRRAPVLARVGFPLALALLLSSSIELLQLYDDSRLCSLSDVASNVAGAAVGTVAGALYRRAFDRFWWRHHGSSLLRPTGGLLLLCCWLGYQVFPLFPSWGRTTLFRRITALEHASISPADTLIVFAEWLAVACLLESVFKARTGWLTLLLMLVPARLLIASRTLGWPDIVGAAAAYVVWLGAPRHAVRRAAPALLAGAIILEELAPFHFQAAGAFNWVPFRGYFRADWQFGFVVLFRKSFWYGAAIWLWRAAGFRLWLTTATAAGILFLLELVQIYLPGRTPEVTDSLLAVLMGALLYLLRDA
ncbi:MAG TPA: VanZ family protein [Bryobacteraceae bacterium]|nr:VanZ family protein [Bryobacteraceae bacterium]